MTHYNFSWKKRNRVREREEKHTIRRKRFISPRTIQGTITRRVGIRRRHPTLIPGTDQHATAAEGIRPVRAVDGKSKTGTLQQALLHHPRRLWSGIRRRRRRLLKVECRVDRNYLEQSSRIGHSRHCSAVAATAVQFPRNEEFLHLLCQQDRITADQYVRPTLLPHGCYTYSRSWRTNY